MDPASRLAERNRLRELRAARLARLRAPASGGADADADAALTEFLRALTGGPVPEPVPESGPAPEPGAVLHFQRPGRPEGPPEPAGDLGRLPGAGPGLIWALERAGLRSLADLAPLGAEELAARLGPIGRLVPARSWIDAAREASLSAR